MDFRAIGEAALGGAKIRADAGLCEDAGRAAVRYLCAGGVCKTCLLHPAVCFASLWDEAELTWTAGPTCPAKGD
jgi:hypothetical protein